MAKKMNKTQAKNLLNAIWSKSQKLWGTPLVGYGGPTNIISTKDLITIEKIIAKSLKHLK